MTTETSNICRWECNRDVRHHEIPNEKIQAGDERGDAMDEPLRWFAYMSRVRVSRSLPASLLAGVIEEDSRDDTEKPRSGLGLRTDHGDRTTCVLASINERSKGIAGIATPRISEFLQLG